MEQITAVGGGKLLNKTNITNENAPVKSCASAAAKAVRVITVPPVMALMLATVLFFTLGTAAFARPINYFEAVFTLTLLPLLPYLICAAVPSMRKKGRKLERSLAIWFSLLGYLMGTLFAILGGGTRVELILYLTYLISGALLALLTFAFRFKASGHTCAAAGPFALLTYLLGPIWLTGYLIMLPIFTSSLKLKRHSVAQLIAGGLVSVGAMFAAIAIAGLIR